MPTHGSSKSGISDEYEVGVVARETGRENKALDEKEYELSDANLVIVNGKNEPVGVAGVKGGADSGINDATKDLLIESANFNAISVRKTSQALKLRTSASQRYERGFHRNSPPSA